MSKLNTAEPQWWNTRPAAEPVDGDLLTARLTANADHLRQCFDIPRLKPAIDDMCIESLLENISQAIAALQQQPGQVQIDQDTADYAELALAERLDRQKRADGKTGAHTELAYMNIRQALDRAKGEG